MSGCHLPIGSTFASCSCACHYQPYNPSISCWCACPAKNQINDLKTVHDLAMIEKRIMENEQRIRELESERDKGIERIKKLESSRLSQELDPKVWVHLNARVDKLESNLCTLQIEFKAKQFKANMDEGNRFMECLAGLENKIQDQIDEMISKRPYKCPRCNGFGKTNEINSMITTKINELVVCCACDGKGIVWG